jgi:hypothetical protein
MVWITTGEDRLMLSASAAITGCFLISAFGFATATIILVRNSATYKRRMELLGRISELSLAEINSGVYDKWKARHDRLNATSYGEMIWKFWKPIRSFYQGEDFWI